jgi:hypothetical protein
MPALLLVLVLLLAGCVPGRAATGGVPTADAPFTLTALDVGQPTCRFRRLAGGQRLIAPHVCSLGQRRAHSAGIPKWVPSASVGAEISA